ncbi:MAG: deaminase [Pseudonocardiaceae bacterium]
MRNPVSVFCTDSARVIFGLRSVLGPLLHEVTDTDLPPGAHVSGTLLALAAVDKLGRQRGKSEPAILVALPQGSDRTTVRALRRILGENVLLVLDTDSPMFDGESMHESLHVLGDTDDIGQSLARLADLVGGTRTVTPSRAEFGMHAAFGAALRSAALRGGVGAALVDQQGDVVALGTAEVPAYRGGQYWDGEEPDARDFQLGGDPATAVRSETVQVLLRLLANQGVRLPSPVGDVANNLLQAFDRHEGSHGVGHGRDHARTFESLGRVVHAEMAALCAAARGGRRTGALTMYVTAQPCRQCLRHLVCAGLDRVIYLGPRLESSPAFHADSVSVHADAADHHLRLIPFSGVGPGAYQSLFGRVPGTAMSGSRGDPRLPRWLGAVTQARPEITAELARAPASARRDELRRLASIETDGHRRKEALT